MEFFIEMFLMVVISLLFSFLVAKLVSLAMAVNDLTENPEVVGVGDDFVKEEEELDSSFKMDAPVPQSERCCFQVVDQNVESVDRFDEVEENGKNSVNCEESVARTADVMVPGNEVGEEMMIQSRLGNDDDDDWEGIERSELEKAFAAAVNYLEAEETEIGAEAKMELYGLHKIATQGSCREAQPMALMVSARAKWNAWHKLGNMSQEEAMEKYLALVSKEIPGWISTTGHTLGKLPETVTSSGSLQEPTTSCVASTKHVSGER